MKDRIENLETLNERLADERFDMNYNRAETAYEKLAWHFFRTKPFDTDILYKGTCARFDEGIERPLTDEGVEEMKARYTHLFTADNQQLRQWLFSTPLENVAAYTTKIVRQTVIDAVVGLYDPAQDFYADNWYEWNDYEHGKITGRQFVENIYAKIDTVEGHVAEGKAMGLTMDEIVLHDCTWGLLPNSFDPDLVKASKEILKEALHQLPDRPYIWSEFGKRVYAPNMLKYAAIRLNEVGVDIGLGTVYTTEQGYLLDYFSRLYWREAASRPED
jgi:hypothetical protein